MPRRRDPISQLETAIECLPRTTREAMLEGIRTRPIIAGAYTDNRGGICPMLAAHRGGGRTSLLSFARSWDAFARAKRVRRATRRELRVLEDLLVASLESETDLGAAIAAHRASAASRPEVVDEPQQPQRGEGLGEEVIRARRGGAVVGGPVGEAGQHDDRGVRGDGVGAQPPAGLDAVEPRHVVVEQDDLRAILEGGFEGLLTVARLSQPEPADVVERGGDEPAYVRVVVDDEDGPAAHPSPSRMRTNASSGTDS
jgi:hypothetical protein